MTDDRIRYFAEKMDVLSRRDRIIINNPVIMQGMGLAPIVIPAISIQNAAIISLAVILLLTPTRIIATFIAQRTGFKMRAVLYALISGCVYIGVAYVLEIVFGASALRSVGVYLPILVLEPLIIKRYESPKLERLFTSLKKGVITTIGFCLVLFLVASIRELLAFGTLGGVEAIKVTLLPLAAMAPGGFITVGLVAALWRGLVNNFKKRVSKGVKGLK